MSIVMQKFCDRCHKRIKDGTGAEVHKSTVNCHAHPIRHLCERCYYEVFADQISHEQALKEKK